MKLTKEEKDLVGKLAAKAEGVVALAKRISSAGDVGPGALAAQLEALALQANNMRQHELSATLSRARVEQRDAELAAVTGTKKREA